MWVEHGDEFVPFRCVGDLLDEPMGGEVWQSAHDVDIGHGYGDPRGGRVPRGPNEARSMGEARRRAQSRGPRCRGRLATHAYDRCVEDDRPREPTTEPDGDEVIWERGGGFSLLTDDDGVWERLT